ncbi:MULTISPECIES: DUF2934 domain-containing protein [Bradyrhizobium]|uniref:DUF2934 domain-containing protein n=2 Tax=Bradyrhizobium japonicum TaxID=375 RepID=A0A1L3FQ04_BRAJP|nr:MULTISPECIES: DUF2934 domain-containing protein [Bradyrhizobium]APG15424.1 hypothetical protein BKD09_44805 [Bradyrhizobium japonicum]MCD9112086.1 DUF2934 domain-containing protein [Bradyrhizobium japonicum]MCD9258601.1 DUF2934 domain-containing protein [Bradyrhizobium japonicum SEMIA 5079]MCD9824398.1 DUF2934 domain-containing protein [Bradyrhizobium japonicum]MCD9897170.1 DUF2934 domain-containing protein [Bradyrhizobium japonicum]
MTDKFWPASGLVSSGVAHMAGPPTQKDIERRAYHLWQQAGMPKERDQEFYLEAERQLKEELIVHELKTPDTL